MTTNLLSSSTMMGTSVTNRAGENLGDVKDIMIDPTTGSVAYVVVSFGGFLGIGDKYFAVPMEAFQINREMEEFILDVDKEKLKNAPGFDKDNWPSTADRQFLTDVHSHYGYKPYWEREHAYRTSSAESIGSSGVGASGMGATGRINRESTADRLGGTGSDRFGKIGTDDPARSREKREDDRDRDLI